MILQCNRHYPGTTNRILDVDTQLGRAGDLLTTPQIFLP